MKTLSCIACLSIPWLATAAQEPAQEPLSREPLMLHDAQGGEHAAELLRVRVPENRHASGAHTIEIACVRVRSTSASPGAPILYLEGGPGQPATPHAQDPASLSSWLPFLELGDLIFIDQRGIGLSTPSLELPFDESLPAGFFADRAVALAYARQCQERCKQHFAAQGVDFSGYNNEENADDVDAVRQALGADQMRLIGYSHGTLLGLTVIRRHGERVERAVLVGTEAPNDWGSLPSALQAQVDKLSQLAALDPGVNHAVPDMAALLARVLDKLERAPLTVEVKDKRTGEQVQVALGRFGLELLLRIDLGDGNDFPLFPAMLWTIDQGRTDLVRWALEKRYNQLARGASAMSTCMILSSGPPAWLEQRIRAEAGACVFHGVVNYFDLELRDIWRVPLLGDEYRRPIVTQVPVLFVSGTLDSNAPPQQAECIRSGFLDSTHLIVPYAGHEDMLPDPQVRDTMRRFLAGEDVRAVRLERPRPSFVAIRRKE